MNGFVYVFQISKIVTFEVSYCSFENDRPYFSTSCIEFVKNKKSFNICGQGLEELLEKDSIAYHFYNKWNKKHLGYLTIDEEKELMHDMKILIDAYNWISSVEVDDIPWDDIVALSELPLKKSNVFTSNF